MTAPGGRPSPSSMARRRTPVIPAAPTPPRRSRYTIAADIPRRGWPTATVWADTGVLLFMGTHKDLPSRFRKHYSGRVRLTTSVDREVRGHSNASPDSSAPAADHQRVGAASRSVREFLLAGQLLPIEVLADEDLSAVAVVVEELKRLGDRGKKHGGEAEIIVIAERLRATSNRPHILLTNDGGASTVAAQHGLPSRHAGDVLAELACANHDLDASTCWQRFQASEPISKIPEHCRPRGKDAFLCMGNKTSCTRCDPPPRERTDGSGVVSR